MLKREVVLIRYVSAFERASWPALWASCGLSPRPWRGEGWCGQAIDRERSMYVVLSNRNPIPTVGPNISVSMPLVMNGEADMQGSVNLHYISASSHSGISAPTHRMFLL